MRIIKLCFFISALMISINSKAQQTAPPGTPSVSKKEKKEPAVKTSSPKSGLSSKLSIYGGLGVANYFGDLMENNRLFSQPGFSFGAGASYALSNQFSAGLNLGIQQVQAADRKNTGVQYKARNLSFKSNIFDVSLAINYYLLSMKKHGFSPYISAGIGTMFFNPYANDVSGKKQYLRELGTEGQGLSGFPGMYSKTAITIPLGAGLKIAAGKNVMLYFDFNYRFTGTDYLDDVSNNSYPAKPLLDARNTTTAKFTWRGNEVGGEAYPTNLKLPRGNPANKDGFYTTQFRVAYAFGKKIKSKKLTTKAAANKLPKDSDGDSISDAYDKCPDVKGSLENNGCPLPFVEGADLINVTTDSMTYSIYFDLDRSILLTDAFKTLKRIVEVLKSDNSLSLSLSGHSDYLGTSAANMKLSEDRVNITRDYLLSYNIASTRINSSFYGETRPIDDMQKWRNRRVEITIIKN
ncbi:MAG: OmpA family protein [Ferruginibacter sp.]